MASVLENIDKAKELIEKFEQAVLSYDGYKIPETREALDKAKAEVLIAVLAGLNQWV